MSITLERFHELQRWIYLTTDGHISYDHSKGCVIDAEEDMLHPYIEDNIDFDIDGKEVIDWPGVWEDMSNA